MSNKAMFAFSLVPIDLVVDFGYPATATVSILTNEDGDVHLINYVGDPTNVFANAPNQSFWWDGTSHHTYSKSGTRGMKDGTTAINT